MTDEPERPDHPRTGPETPRPKGRVQKTPKDYVVPVPTEDDFIRDLKRASRKTGSKPRDC